MDSRRHRRVRLRLPVRLRWTAPLGQRVESGVTMDASRSGLLVSTNVPHAPGVSLWVTFPYDSAAVGEPQPEVLARVIRCQAVPESNGFGNAKEKIPAASVSDFKRLANPDTRVRALGVNDGAANFAVALQFDGKFKMPSNGNAHRREPERRASPRRALAVPVRVRPEQIPWFEEAMSIDFSSQGMRFRSHREYELGQFLKIAFAESAVTPWSGSAERLGSGKRSGSGALSASREFRAKVVRMESSRDSTALDVSVFRA